MGKTVKNPDLNQQIRLGMASMIRIHIAAKTIFAPLLAIVIPVLIVFLVSNQTVKTYSIIGGVALFFAFVLFYLLSPKIISKKFQLKKYITDLGEQADVWKKLAEEHKDKRNIILNKDALSLNSYPEISKGLQKIFSESVKLIQNIGDSFEISARQAVNQYNHLCIQYIAAGDENPLYESIQKVIETLKKSRDDRFTAATTLLENCKAEQKNLPNRASVYKTKLVEFQQREISQCENEIKKINDKKNQAVLMLENL